MGVRLEGPEVPGGELLSRVPAARRRPGPQRRRADPAARRPPAQRRLRQARRHPPRRPPARRPAAPRRDDPLRLRRRSPRPLVPRPQLRRNMRFEGKSVLVTGAGHGIGRAVAERFASEGASVGVNDIDPDARGARPWPRSATDAIALPGDVGSEEDVKRIVAARGRGLRPDRRARQQRRARHLRGRHAPLPRGRLGVVEPDHPDQPDERLPVLERGRDEHGQAAHGRDHPPVQRRRQPRPPRDGRLRRRQGRDRGR